VDGAGADHDEQAVIALLDDLDGFIAAGADGLNRPLGLDKRLGISCGTLDWF
jgi:hypothetical protein